MPLWEASCGQNLPLKPCSLRAVWTHCERPAACVQGAFWRSPAPYMWPLVLGQGRKEAGSSLPILLPASSAGWQGDWEEDWGTERTGRRIGGPEKRSGSVPSPEKQSAPARVRGVCVAGAASPQLTSPPNKGTFLRARQGGCARRLLPPLQRALVWCSFFPS